MFRFDLDPSITQEIQVEQTDASQVSWSSQAWTLGY